MNSILHLVIKTMLCTPCYQLSLTKICRITYSDQFLVDSLGVDHVITHRYTGTISSFALFFGLSPPGNVFILNIHSSHFVELYLIFFLSVSYVFMNPCVGHVKHWIWDGILDSERGKPLYTSRPSPPRR